MSAVHATELTYLSIAEAGARIRRRELSAVELTRACLEAIAERDGAINAFITVRAEQALEDAEAVDAEVAAGHLRGPLHGIPIAHKDLLSTRDLRTTAGSKIFAELVPDHDATVVARLHEAGTVLLGKLNMHELAAGATSDNPYYGAVHNPWDLRRIPGGSSGGSAAALAGGLCLATTGSDTAGSIRIPSHFCGTTGLKPTYGRVSAWGAVPLAWSLDHVGPMTRSAYDAALMLNVMAGFDRNDSASVERPAEDFCADLDAGVRGLRIGVPSTYFTEPLQPAVESAWRRAIDVLVELGATVVDVQVRGLDDATDLGTRIVRPEMATYHAELFAQHPDAYSPPMHARFEEARRRTALDYVAAQRARERIRHVLWTVFEHVHVLVTPSVPATATPIGSDNAAVGDRQVDLGSVMTRFTYPFNLSGFPSLAVPAGFDDQGLPTGVQIAGPPWREALLLRVGHAFQRATDWHTRRPRLPAVQPRVRGAV